MDASDLHISSLSTLSPDQITRAIESLSDEQAEQLLHDWRFVARPEQVEPPGDWRTWLFMAGRGAGKTRSGAEWVREQVKAGCGRIALIAPTAADSREVMVDGESGVLAVCWEKDKDSRGNLIGRPLYEPSKRRLTWGNGAIATTYSAEEPERLRGPQSDAIWADELAAWARPETWDMAMFGLRLGRSPRAMVTTTPKPVPLVRRILKDATSVVTRGTTFDNAANLPASTVEWLETKYGGTRLGRQELNAELLDDVVGALWTRDMIDQARSDVRLPDMQRIVVAIDPSGTGGEGDDGDEVGIVVAGKGVDGRGYILADRSCKLSPDGWGQRAVGAYHEFNADRIVAERNYGGAMVKHVIKTIDDNVAYTEVVASRGKVVRAEPVAALYEQDKVKHTGDLELLEDQMCEMTGSGFVGAGSPDRVDAAVWAITDLMLEDQTTAAVIVRKRHRT